MKSLLTRLVAVLFLSSTAAWGAPTAQLGFGATAVKLDPGFVAALGQLEIAPSAIGPGSFNGRRATFRFPSPTGVLDLASLEGDIAHTGGIKLAKDGVHVSLLNFVIETYSTLDPLTGEDRSPVLTTAAVLDGSVLGRYGAFDLDFSEIEIRESRYGRLVIKNVGVSLSAAGALALNTAFFGGDDVIPAGLPVGVAKVSTRILRLQGDIDYDDDDDEDEDDEDDDDGDD